MSNLSLIRNQLMFPLWFSSKLNIPFMPHLGKSGIEYIGDVLSLQGEFVNHVNISNIISYTIFFSTIQRQWYGGEGSDKIGLPILLPDILEPNTFFIIPKH